MCTKITIRKSWIQILFLPVLVLVSMTSATAQDLTVTGKITDRETGEGLPGVSVVVQGTSEGTITDIEGNYKVTASRMQL